MNDLPQTEHVTMSLFADDTALLTSSWRTDTITNRLQKSVDKIQKYFQKWKIKLNAAKTESILFSKRRPTLKGKVTVQDSNIEWSPQVKYLGVILDKKLLFTKHTKYVCNKAYGALSQMFPIFNHKNKLSKENKLTIYKTTIRPILTYAAPVWSSMCNSNFSSLQIIQNKSLRIVTSYPRYTPIGLLHDMTDMVTLKQFITDLTKSFFNKCSASAYPIICNIGNYSVQELPYKYKHKRVKHLITNVG